MLRSIVAIIVVFTGLSAQESPLKLRTERSHSTFSVRVLNTDGRTVTRIEREQFFDAAPPAVHLFGNGSLLLMDGYAGVLEHYNAGGTMTSRILIRSSVRPDHERVIVWSATESQLALAVSEPNEEPVSVLLLDDQGTLVLRQSLAARTHASGIVLSPDGSLLAAGTYGWEGASLVHSIDFMQADGSVLSSASVEMKKGAFADDRSRFLAVGSSSVSIVDVPAGSVISAKQLERGSVIHDAVWDGDIAVIAASPRPAFQDRQWVFPALLLFSLSPDGESTASETIPRSFRNVQLRREGGGIGIVLDGRVMQRGED